MKNIKLNPKFICAALILSAFLNGCASFHSEDGVSANKNNNQILLTDLTKPANQRIYLLPNSAGE